MKRELLAAVATGLRGWAEGIEKRFKPSDDPPGWYVTAMGGTSTAGASVTDSTALTLTAVWSCVRVLSESVACLPLILYRRLPGGGKERATDHPLYDLLHNHPNPRMTAYEWKQAQMVGLCRRGNCFSYVERDGSYRVRAIWNLRSDQVEPFSTPAGDIAYLWTRSTGEQKVFIEREIMHRRLFSDDGLLGLSPVGYAREAIGTALAMQESGARLFGSGFMPRVAIEMGNKKFKDDDAQERFRTEVQQKWSGSKNWERVLMLTDGMKWVNTSFNAEDSQFLQSRKFQVTEIARIFRVPPHMIADLDRATFSNIEHLSLEFVMFNLMPYLVGWEERLNVSLLSDAEREEYFFQFLMDGLLRGDTQTRYSAYDLALRNGWMNADEVRERENMNPIPGGAGKVYRVQANTVPADVKPNPKPVPKPAPAPAPAAGDDGGGDDEDDSSSDRSEKLESLARAIAAGAGGNGTPH